VAFLGKVVAFYSAIFFAALVWLWGPFLEFVLINCFLDATLVVLKYSSSKLSSSNSVTPLIVHCVHIIVALHSLRSFIARHYSLRSLFLCPFVALILAALTIISSIHLIAFFASTKCVH
jgi:hypothetical protein